LKKNRTTSCQTMPALWALKRGLQVMERLVCIAEQPAPAPCTSRRSHPPHAASQPLSHSTDPPGSQSTILLVRQSASTKLSDFPRRCLGRHMRACYRPCPLGQTAKSARMLADLPPVAIMQRSQVYLPHSLSLQGLVTCCLSPLFLAMHAEKQSTHGFPRTPDTHVPQWSQTFAPIQPLYKPQMILGRPIVFLESDQVLT